MRSKEELEYEFFKAIPKARKINPFFRSIFEFMYEVYEVARPGKKLLNIYTSKDMSGGREDVYKKHFFTDCEFDEIDFWENRFIYKGNSVNELFTLPFPDASFDILVTTKYILEHVAEPEKVLKEFRRILKSEGEIFLVAAHVRRQHQKPNDYFRYTEFGLEYLFKKVGFHNIVIKPTNGAFGTFGEYAYFFQRGLGLPKWLEKCFDFLHYWIVQSVCFFIDGFDNGYGRDLTQYFTVRAKV